MSTRKSSGNSRRILATVGVVGALGILGGLGTYSAFTSTVAAGPQTVSSATLNLTNEGDTFSMAANGVVPGDTIDRTVTIKNSGSSAFGSIGLVSAGTGGLTSHLTMQIDACPTAWSGAPGTALTCAGATNVVPSGTVARTMDLAGLAALAPNGESHLRVRIALPGSAGNDAQGLSSSISYTFTGNQIAGTAK